MSMATQQRNGFSSCDVKITFHFIKRHGAMNSTSIIRLRRLSSPGCENIFKIKSFWTCLYHRSSYNIHNNCFNHLTTNLFGSSPNNEVCPEFHKRSCKLWYSSLRYSLKVLIDSKCFRCNLSSSNHVGSSFNRPKEKVFWYVESKMSAPIAKLCWKKDRNKIF